MYLDQPTNVDAVATAYTTITVTPAEKTTKSKRGRPKAVASSDEIVVKANEGISNVLDELKEFLHKKNISYAGSAFKEVVYGGKVISPLEAVDVRITDKIRRLTGGGKGYMGEPDEADLLGYLVIKLVLAKLAEKKKQNEKLKRKTRKQRVSRA